MVKRAEDDYMVRHALHSLIIGPLLLDRLARDLCGYMPADPSVQDMTSPADQ